MILTLEISLAFLTPDRWLNFMHRIPSALVLRVVFFTVAVSLSGPSLGAQEKVYEIAELQARLELLPSGAYRIREAITYDFQVGSFTFAERDIPLSNIDGVSPVTVRSPDVTINSLQQEEEGDVWRVRWEFPATSGTVTFVLEYDLFAALREVEQTNEVFWRVVGRGWDVPFHRVEAEVVLPSTLPLALSDLTLEPADIASARTEDGNLVARFRPGFIPAGDAYQVRVSFPKVMDGRAVGLARTDVQASVAGIFSFALFLGLGSFLTFRRLGPRLPIRRQTHVGMKLPTAAVLLHRAAPGWERAFPATLFDLADRGVITLERVDRKKGWFTSQKTRLHRNQESDEPLDPFEAALLAELEKYEELDDFATKGRKFRKAVMKGVRAALVETGHLVDGRREANRALLVSLVLCVLSVITLIGGGVLGSPWIMALGGAGLGLATGAALVGSVRFPRSRKGAEALAELKGYLQGLREDLQQKMKMSPISAAEFLFSTLPWLTMDPKYYGAEGRKLARALKKETGDLRAPSWALDRTKAYEKAAAKYSAAYMAFFPFNTVTGATSGAVAPSAGGGVGGAGGGGAAGGGGGGAG
jgi:hypothetical protein